MAHRNKDKQSGRKAGSIIDDPADIPAQKSKPKKQKKQSKGKQKH